MSSPIQRKQIEQYVAYIKSFAQSNLKSDIDNVPYEIIQGIGAGNARQAGLYFAQMNQASRNFWQKELEKVGVKFPVDNKLVAINGESAERDDQRYFGAVFHEYGHAAMDKLGKNGSAVGEQNAWAVELMALEMFIGANQDKAEAAKTYAKARKRKSCYSKFTEDFRDKAKKAYQAITGEEM